MKKIILSIGLVLVTATAFGVVQIKASPDKPWRVFLLSDAQNLDATTYNKETVYENANGDFQADDDDGSWQDQTWINYHHAWFSGIGGAGSEYNNWQNDYWDWQNNHSGSAGGMTGNMVWDWTGWGSEVGTHNDGTTTTGFTNTLSIWNKIGNEHCDVSDPFNTKWDNDNLDYDDDGDKGSEHDTYTRTAQTVWHVQTGGKAVPRLLNLWQFSGSATEILNKRAVPPFSGAAMREITDKTQIAIGSMGNLGTNGIRYNLLPNGIEQDITPKVAGKDFYTFSVGGQKYLSYFDLYVQQASPGYSFYPVGENDYGHAFWRFRTDAPSDALQYVSTNLTKFLNKKWGFYPTNDPPPSLWNLQTVQGFVQDDSTHPTNICRTFYIGFYPDLLNGLEFTKGISSTPPMWSATGYNCVSATRSAGFAADVFGLPSDTSPQNFGVTLIEMYPAPGQVMGPFIDINDVFYSSAPY